MDRADAVTADPEVLAALDEGRAYADVSGWWKTLVRGAEARAWLNDLVSAGIADLREGASRRSLLLTPTGRIRADFTVAAVPGGFLLVQDARQPEPVASLLRPYVLSSDVALEDRSDAWGLLAFPGDDRSLPHDPGGDAATAYRPSCLGTGVDMVVTEGHGRGAGVPEDRVVADPSSLEAWRIIRGVARFPVDLTTESLPHEAGLDHAIEYGKGCFLGQEAVAKVRNLGRPPRVVLAARADGPVTRGEAVVSGGEEVGEVTSACPLDGTAAVIIRVRWAARESALETSSGRRLAVAGPASGAT